MWIIAQTVTPPPVTEELSTSEQITRYGQTALDAVVLYAPKLAIAVVMAFVGWKLANFFSRWLHRALEMRAIDSSLRPFLASLLDTAIKVALVVTVIGYLGIPTASFVAVIGAAGVAIGLALSGTLQNFAGGVILLVLRPFTVGDLIRAQSFEGKVKEILIFQTVLVTADGLTVFIPNGKLLNESIINFSTQGTRRVDLTFGIGYDDNIEAAREVILKLAAADPRINKTPEPSVIVQNLGDSTVDVQARFWVATADHFKVTCEMREKVKKTFDANKISFPFPQIDYHVIEQPNQPVTTEG